MKLGDLVVKDKTWNKLIAIIALDFKIWYYKMRRGRYNYPHNTDQFSVQKSLEQFKILSMI